MPKNKNTRDSGADMVKGPGMIPRHRRNRSASPSLVRCPPDDSDRWAKRLKTNKRARSASPSLSHRSPTNSSNRSAKKSKRTHHSDDVIPDLMGEEEASASTRNNGPSPVPSPASVDSRSTTEKKDQHAHRMTVNHRPTRRSASPSLPHRPPIDSERSTYRKLKTTHNSGGDDTIIIPVRTGEEEGDGVSRHHDTVPSIRPLVDDSISSTAKRNQQQAHHTEAGILVPTTGSSHKCKKNEVILINHLPYRPKLKEPTLVEMPAAKRLKKLPWPPPQQKQKTRSSVVFPEPKTGWKSVSVGWNFGGPPSSRRERDDLD